jgi:hypothetical protein
MTRSWPGAVDAGLGASVEGEIAGLVLAVVCASICIMRSGIVLCFWLLCAAYYSVFYSFFWFFLGVFLFLRCSMPRIYAARLLCSLVEIYQVRLLYIVFFPKDFSYFFKNN